MISEKGSEFISVVGTIDPDVLTAAAHSSDYVDMADYDQLVAIVMLGTLDNASTIAAKLQQATSAGGAGVKDISGKAISSIAAASPSTNDDQQFIINLRAAELDLDNNFRYVKLVVTVGVASSDGGAVLLGVKARYEPASGTDIASVEEIV